MPWLFRDYFSLLTQWQTDTCFSTQYTYRYPNIIVWFLARIVQQIVTGLTAAVGVDQPSDRVSLNQLLGTQRLSGVLGLIVYILKLEAITQPASNMFDTILDKLPDIFAAILVLAIAYIVGKILAGLITNVLTSMGFNAVLAKLGLGKEPQQGGKTPSEIAGYLVLVAIMLFATTEALNTLGFSTLAGLIAQFLVFSGHIILGILIFAIGLYLAKVYDVVGSSNTPQARLLSAVACIPIIVLPSAIALHQMGLANEIINLAFGLLISSLYHSNGHSVWTGRKRGSFAEEKKMGKLYRVKKRKNSF